MGNQDFTARPLPTRPTLEEDIRSIVKKEIAAQFERLESKITTLEMELRDAKCNMSETVNTMSGALDEEMNRLQNHYKAEVVKEAIAQIRNRTCNN